MPSQEDLSSNSLGDLGTTVDRKAFHHGLSNYDEVDCESCGTVVELEAGSEGTLSSQAEDANMRNDLYSELDRFSQGDDTLTNDSIDEDEFPLETIAESTLECQKTQDSAVGDNFYDMPLKTDANSGTDTILGLNTW